MIEQIFFAVSLYNYNIQQMNGGGGGGGGG